MRMKSITDGTEDIPQSMFAAGRTVIIGEMTTIGKMRSIGRKAAAGGTDTPEAEPMRKHSISGGLPMTIGKEQETEGADTTGQIPAGGGTTKRKRILRVPSTIGTAKPPGAGIPVSSGRIPTRIPIMSVPAMYRKTGIPALMARKVDIHAMTMARKIEVPAITLRKADIRAMTMAGRRGILAVTVRKGDIRAAITAMRIEILAITVREGELSAMIMTGKMAVPVMMDRKTDILTVITAMRAEALVIAAGKTDTHAMLLTVRTEMPGHPTGGRKIFRQEGRTEAGSSLQKEKPVTGRHSPVRRITRWQIKQRNLKGLKRKSGKRSIAC